MKKTMLLLCAVALLCSQTLTSIAQIKQTVTISKLEQQQNKIAFTVVSTGKFYIGNNIHVLYIDDKRFDLYQESNENGTGSLTYYISAKEFDALNDGAKVYLSYGEVTFENEQGFLELCKSDPTRHWVVGSLDKSMLK